MLISIMIEAITRPLREIERFSCQFRIAFPNILEFSRRSRSSGEERAKKKQAKSAKGVLGNIGKGTPAIARAKDVYPAPK